MRSHPDQQRYQQLADRQATKHRRLAVQPFREKGDGTHGLQDVRGLVEQPDSDHQQNRADARHCA